MLVAHISDFHVFAEAPETSLVRADAAEAARKVIADIVAFRPRIDAVMFTGDLTDGGGKADYDLLLSILAPLDMPICVVPGNHDKRYGMREAFGTRLPFAEGAYLNYDVEIDALRVIGLDTLVDGRIEGRLVPKSLDWLGERLAQRTEKLTYLLLHHPPFPSGINGLDEMALVEGGERLGALVGNYTGRLHVLSGHLHRPYQSLWHGVFAAVGGSPAFQVDLDLEPGAPEPGTVQEPYSYFIHWLGVDGTSVHRRFVSL